MFLKPLCLDSEWCCSFGMA